MILTQPNAVSRTKNYSFIRSPQRCDGRIDGRVDRGELRQEASPDADTNSEGILARLLSQYLEA